MVHGTPCSAGGKLPQAICSFSLNGAAHLQQPCKKDESKVAYFCMQALALMGKYHVTEERGEEFVMFFVLCKGMELAEWWVDVTIVVNRDEQ